MSVVIALLKFVLPLSAIWYVWEKVDEGVFDGEGYAENRVLVKLVRGASLFLFSLIYVMGILQILFHWDFVEKGVLLFYSAASYITIRHVITALVLAAVFSLAEGLQSVMGERRIYLTLVRNWDDFQNVKNNFFTSVNVLVDDTSRIVSDIFAEKAKATDQEVYEAMPYDAFFAYQKPHEEFLAQRENIINRLSGTLPGYQEKGTGIKEFDKDLHSDMPDSMFYFEQAVKTLEKSGDIKFLVVTNQSAVEAKLYESQRADINQENMLETIVIDDDDFV